MWKWKDLTLDQIKRIVDDHRSTGYTILQIIAYPHSCERVDQIVSDAEAKGMYLAMVTG
jgi:hypothetical protein